MTGVQTCALPIWILVDVVDVSDALSNDNQYSRQEVDTIIKELPNYGVSKETSLDDRIRTAFERLVTRPNRWVTGGMVCALTVLASVFIAVSVLDQASDHSLDERRRRLEYMQKQFNACWNVIQGIRQIVLTKLFNIKNALESCEKIAQRDSCRDCVTILDPDGQIQTMVESAHGWFRSMGSEPAALRVALYIEDDVH